MTNPAPTITDEQLAILREIAASASATGGQARTVTPSSPRGTSTSARAARRDAFIALATSRLITYVEVFGYDRRQPRLTASGRAVLAAAPVTWASMANHC